jgi:glycosyltransferase involved in cell wall biosynthesis
MREVCLVVPCYNEERRLDGEAFRNLLASRDEVSICFVNDGSADGTLGVLQRLRAGSPERVLVVNLVRNAGKAEAVRQGALYAGSLRRFGVIGYWDADLSTPLRELDRLLAALDSSDRCRLSMGSRVKRLGSTIDRRAARHYLGRVLGTFASLLLDLPVYDSQCGAKVFRSDVTDVLFGDPFVSIWLFDLEILLRLRRHVGPTGFPEAATEVPLTAWREVGGSKLTLAAMLTVPVDLLRISAKY